MALRPNDILFAYKAIGLTPVSSAAHRVGNALIDHFNRKTGQCDPGTERLAALLGIDTKTVKTATAQLCDAGLFTKISHGGGGHRASYAPQWQTYTQIVRDWDAKMRGKSEPENGAKTPPSDDSNGAKTPLSTGRKRPFERGENAPQTNISNQSYKPIRPSHASDSTEDNVVPMRSEQPLHRLWKGNKGRSPSHALVAREEARRRWDLEMRNRCGTTEAYARFLEWITEDANELATAAEMSRRGGGAALLVDRMHVAGLVVSGE
ncbi:hypothetical protein HA461_20385 [Rhizobium leguminosarum bv. trifolii]|uniref:hypothetical protein n=1 Tax=Rhizobium leguminosarum TaxID=384 RepID=UPI00140F5F81|nr:hypothetical protein [Rhizobium leguminosarum]QIO53384.1 hypothetical protein HA461_20385 [Rhizobium leguminosarum bv. trifolii]